MFRSEEGIRPYILIPWNRGWKNQFERIVYFEAKERNSIISAQIKKAFFSEHPEWLSPKYKQIEAWENRKIEELKRKIMKEVAKLELDNVESFEGIIDSFFHIFRKHFVEARCYPTSCQLAALITEEIFNELGYEVKVMKSKKIHHYFTVITDKITGLTWIFDPVAEQFEWSFGNQYRLSRYEKNIQYPAE